MGEGRYLAADDVAQITMPFTMPDSYPSPPPVSHIPAGVVGEKVYNYLISLELQFDYGGRCRHGGPVVARSNRVAPTSISNSYFLCSVPHAAYYALKYAQEPWPVRYPY